MAPYGNVFERAWLSMGQDVLMAVPTQKQTLRWFLDRESDDDLVDPSLRGTTVLAAAHNSGFIEPGDEDGFAENLLQLHELGRIKMMSHTLSKPGGELLFRSNLNFELQQVTGMTSTTEGQQWAINAAALDAAASTGNDSAAVDAKRKFYGTTMTERNLPEWPQDRKAVMVVHGRNSPARDAMFAFLKSLGLTPLEFSDLVEGTGDGAPYVGDVLAHAFKTAKAAVVLFTPDDEAKLRREFHAENEPSHERELTPQARPNVLFEAGMALAALPKATLLVELGSVRPFSDIYGRHVIRLQGDLDGALKEIARRLKTANCDVTLPEYGVESRAFAEVLESVAGVNREVEASQDAAAIRDLNEDMERWIRDRDHELEVDIKIRSQKLRTAIGPYSGAYFTSIAQAKVNALQQYRDEVTHKRRTYRDLSQGVQNPEPFKLSDASRAIVEKWRAPVTVNGMDGSHEIDDPTSVELEPSIRDFESNGDGGITDSV